MFGPFEKADWPSKHTAWFKAHNLTPAWARGYRLKTDASKNTELPRISSECIVYGLPPPARTPSLKTCPSGYETQAHNPPKQKSRVERLNAKVETFLTSVTVDCCLRRKRRAWKRLYHLLPWPQLIRRRLMTFSTAVQDLRKGAAHREKSRESGTSQSKSGTSACLSNSGLPPGAQTPSVEASPSGYATETHNLARRLHGYLAHKKRGYLSHNKQGYLSHKKECMVFGVMPGARTPIVEAFQSTYEAKPHNLAHNLGKSR